MGEGRQIRLLFLITLSIGVLAVISVAFLPGVDQFFTSPPAGSGAGTARLFGYGTIVLVIAFPFLFLGMYALFGAEKRCTVPEYLSTVPDPDAKPWIVNLLFTGDPLDFDENGFYATLLDLHRKGVIQISVGSLGHARIQVLKGQTGDPYEDRVLDFLKGLTSEDALDLEKLGASFEPAGIGDPEQEVRAKQAATFRLLISAPGLLPTRRYIENGLKRILPLGCLGIILQATTLIIAGGEAGNLERTVVLSLFASALLAISLATMWRVQENSLKRGLGKGTLPLMALYGGIALYFLLFSTLTV
ncbi:MAG TPA: hypothetical protein VEI51_05310, partial [Methanomicrobiales archaeon]|nr:hypothetical protein [Methanomicrobiales archaeon]